MFAAQLIQFVAQLAVLRCVLAYYFADAPHWPFAVALARHEHQLMLEITARYTLAAL